MVCPGKWGHFSRLATDVPHHGCSMALPSGGGSVCLRRSGTRRANFLLLRASSVSCQICLKRSYKHLWNQDLTNLPLNDCDWSKLDKTKGPVICASRDDKVKVAKHCGCKLDQFKERTPRSWSNLVGRKLRSGSAKRVEPRHGHDLIYLNATLLNEFSLIRPTTKHDLLHCNYH